MMPAYPQDGGIEVGRCPLSGVPQLKKARTVFVGQVQGCSGRTASRRKLFSDWCFRCHFSIYFERDWLRGFV